VTVDKDKDTLTINLTNVSVVDQIRFPGGTGNNLGTAGVPATVSFNATYKKVKDTHRHVRPATNDPLSPFNWAGDVWTATNSGSFTLAYNDGSFSAQGTFSSTGPDGTAVNFGEIGAERNGSFVGSEDLDSKAAAGQLVSPSVQSATQPARSPMFKGRVPVKYLVGSPQ